MRVIMVRSLKGYPDSRVEKELFSISKEHNVSFFGWNRYNSCKEITHEIVYVYGTKIDFFHFNKIAPIGMGFKKIFFPLIEFWISEYKFLKKNRRKYDVIHACDFDTIVPALIIAKKYNKKIVYDIFDYYSEAHNGPKLVKKFIKRLEDNAIGQSDITIICSETRKEQIKDSNPKSLYIIHNTPIDSKGSVDKSNIIVPTNKIKLAYIGLLSEDRYLREIASVIEKRNDIVWHVGGWGPLTLFFDELAKKCQNVVFYGEVSYKKAIDIEQQCDIMTALYNPNVPNHKYAAPNKFYESLMLGKPLIMIKGTGVDNYVTKFDIGEVIDLDKENFLDGFSVALDKIVNCDNIDEIGYRSRKIYESEFCWSKMEERILNAYRSIE